MCFSPRLIESDERKHRNHGDINCICRNTGSNSKGGEARVKNRGEHGKNRVNKSKKSVAWVLTESGIGLGDKGSNLADVSSKDFRRSKM